MRYVISIACLAVLATAQRRREPDSEPFYHKYIDQAPQPQYAHGIERAPVQSHIATRVPLGYPPPRPNAPTVHYPPAPPYPPRVAHPLSKPALAQAVAGRLPDMVPQHAAQHKDMGDGEMDKPDFGNALEFMPTTTEFRRPLEDPHSPDIAIGENWPVYSEILGTLSVAVGDQSEDVSSNSLAPTTAETNVAALGSVAPTVLVTPAVKMTSSIPAPATSTRAVLEPTYAKPPANLPPPEASLNATYPAMGATNDTQRAGGIIRVPASQYATDLLTMPTQDVLGDVRQEPSSGMSMGYHGHGMVRGVNIGGFLVPEFWITPSLIANIPDPKPTDYLQLCNRLGPDATLSLMRRHWETWITESEVQRLASAGITHLRIPLGHWEFVDSDEGYVRGGLPYFKRLVYWANRHGLKVIPDMHTAPGSQNGFDNSGSTNGVNWTKDSRNVSISKRALQTMLKYIAGDPILLATTDAVDLLNEPFIDSLDFGQLWDYDTGGHTLVSSGLGKTPPVVSIVDRGFKEFSWWQTRWPRDWNTKYADAWLDAHLYHVFDRNIDDWPLESHLRLVCQNGRNLRANSTSFPIIVGEWSLALPQAALSGRENEARRRFAEAQLDAYELGGAGWIFWCFKTEVSPEWSFLDALDRSWMPQPLSNREFSPICKY